MRLLAPVVRSSINVVVLFSALVLTPLLALSHFSAGLAGMLGSFADNYLPRPTLLNTEKKSRAKADSKLREQRVLDGRERAAKRRAAAASNKVVGNKGRRVLQRGAGALAVGWIPVIGVAADVASLSADYADVCALFATIDEMSAMLYLPDSSLYTDNYCDVPEQGIEIIKESAETTHFPWSIEGP
jgi:hypothetical protein